MFLAAAPYFAHRFRSNGWLLSHFQSAEVSVSCFVNLTSMIALSKLQKKASYPRRIILSLFIYMICFVLLSISTLFHTSAGVYFGFLMAVILFASLSTGLIQNGLFAYVTGFGRPEYTQAIMSGQAIAGVLPPLAQIVAVLAVPAEDIEHKRSPDDRRMPSDPSDNKWSAFAYFSAATAVSVFSLLAFFYLLRRRSSSHSHSTISDATKTTANGTSEGSAVDGSLAAETGDFDPRSAEPVRESIPLTTLFRKLSFLSLAVFICFGLTMVFPVFTVSIQSVNSTPGAIFIPVAFLMWNLGDLLGRLITLYPTINLTHYPFALFCFAMSRFIFIPLYMLCNIGGNGAVVKSDLFYLVAVQLLFGLTSGYIGSNCMMAIPEWVKEEEREAAGGYMGLCLVAGLTAGSLLSFAVGGV
jgi:solute carrier family 29 (equilibrative nucleoside transporter), member 1/2/3